MDIMEEPISFYKAQRKHHQSTSKAIFKKMGWFSVLRLLVFGVTIIGIYLTFSNWKLAFIIIAAGIFRGDWMIGCIGAFILIVGDAGMLILSLLEMKI